MTNIKTPKTMEELLASLSSAPISLERGQEVEGTVVAISASEVTVDLGLKSEGVIGARELPEGNSHKIGDKLKAVIEGESESGQIILALPGKQELSPSRPKSEIPSEKWDNLIKKFENEEVIKGKVAKATQFGVFVTLEPGIEGLIHSSKLGPDDSFEAGKEISVTIDNLDKDKKRITLSPVLTSTKGLIYK